MLCEDIADTIAALGYGTRTGAIDTFAYKLPADPAGAVAVIAYFGGAAQRTFCGLRFERARFQVIVRGATQSDDPQCWRRAYNIYRALDQIVDQNINGIRYLGIEGLQPPFELRRDENELLEVVTNFEAWKEPG
jgi:hypothetical protein